MSSNLINNNSFQTLAANQVPVGWRVFGSPTLAKGSAALSHGDGVMQTIAYKMLSGKSYTISVDTDFSDTDADGYLVIGLFDGTTNQLQGDLWKIPAKQGSTTNKSQSITLSQNLEGILAFQFVSPAGVSCTITNITLPGAGGESAFISAGTNLIQNPLPSSSESQDWNLVNAAWWTLPNSVHLTPVNGEAAIFSTIIPYYVQPGESYTVEFAAWGKSKPFTVELKNAITGEALNTWTITTPNKMTDFSLDTPTIGANGGFLPLLVFSTTEENVLLGPNSSSKAYTLAAKGTESVTFSAFSPLNLVQNPGLSAVSKQVTGWQLSNATASGSTLTLSDQGQAFQGIPYNLIGSKGYELFIDGDITGGTSPKVTISLIDAGTKQTIGDPWSPAFSSTSKTYSTTITPAASTKMQAYLSISYSGTGGAANISNPVLLPVGGEKTRTGAGSPLLGNRPLDYVNGEVTDWNITNGSFTPGPGISAIAVLKPTKGNDATLSQITDTLCLAPGVYYELLSNIKVEGISQPYTVTAELTDSTGQTVYMAWEAMFSKDGSVQNLPWYPTCTDIPAYESDFLITFKAPAVSGQSPVVSISGPIYFYPSTLEVSLPPSKPTPPPPPPKKVNIFENPTFEVVATNQIVDWIADGSVTVDTASKTASIGAYSSLMQVSPYILEQGTVYLASFDVEFTTSSSVDAVEDTETGTLYFGIFDGKNGTALTASEVAYASAKQTVHVPGYSPSSNNLPNPILAFYYLGAEGTTAQISNLSLPGAGSETTTISQGQNMVQDPEFVRSKGGWMIVNGDYSVDSGSTIAVLSPQSGGKGTLSTILPYYVPANSAYTFTFSAKGTSEIDVSLIDSITGNVVCSGQVTPQSATSWQNVNITSTINTHRGGSQPLLQFSTPGQVSIKDIVVNALGTEASLAMPFSPLNLVQNGSFTVLDSANNPVSWLISSGATLQNSSVVITTGTLEQIIPYNLVKDTEYTLSFESEFSGTGSPTSSDVLTVSLVDISSGSTICSQPFTYNEASTPTIFTGSLKIPATSPTQGQKILFSYARGSDTSQVAISNVFIEPTGQESSIIPLGSNLVQSPSFAASSDWTVTNGTINATGSSATLNPASGKDATLVQDWPYTLPANTFYTFISSLSTSGISSPTTLTAAIMDSQQSQTYVSWEMSFSSDDSFLDAPWPLKQFALTDIVEKPTLVITASTQATTAQNITITGPIVVSDTGLEAAAGKAPPPPPPPPAHYTGDTQIRYMTYDNATQNTQLPVASNFKLTPMQTYVEMTWDYPSDMSNVGGFVIRRSTTAFPQKMTDGILFYIGMRNKLTDVYSDAGLNPQDSYYYTIFTVSKQLVQANSDYVFEYSSPVQAPAAVKPTGTVKPVTVQNGDFSESSGGKPTGWVIDGQGGVTVEQGSGPGEPANYVKMTPNTSTVAKTITYLNQTITGLNPKTLYQIKLKTFASSTEIAPTISVTGGTPDSAGGLFCQQILHDQPITCGSCTCEEGASCVPNTHSLSGNCSVTPQYGLGPLVYSYADESTINKWNPMGSVFYTGVTADSPVKNSWNQPVYTGTPAFDGSITIQLSVAPNSDDSLWVGYADIELYEAIGPYTNDNPPAAKGTNLLKNSSFSAYPTDEFWNLSYSKVVTSSSGNYVQLQGGATTAKASQNLTQCLVKNCDSTSISYQVEVDVCFDIPEGANVNSALVQVGKPADKTPLLSWPIKPSAVGSSWKTLTSKPFTISSESGTSPDLCGVQFLLYAYKGQANNWSVSFRNPTIKASGCETPDSGFPIPALAWEPVTWTFKETAGVNILTNLYENSASVPNNGMLLLSQKGSMPENLSYTTTKDNSGADVDVLQIDAYGNQSKLNGQGGLLVSSQYYPPGKFTVTAKFGDCVDQTGATKTPVGCCFATWPYNEDYFFYPDPRFWFQFDIRRNSEIDIETPGSWPKSHPNWNFHIARLNTWGAQWGSEGKNLEWHHPTPTDSTGKCINIADGQFHTVEIMWHPGNYTASGTRNPGFVKWFIDGQYWGGWTGSDFGYDLIPIYGMRLYTGFWFPEQKTDPSGKLGPSWAGIPDWEKASYYISQVTWNPLEDSDCTLPTIDNQGGTNIGQPTRFLSMASVKPVTTEWSPYPPTQSASAEVYPWVDWSKYDKKK